MPQVNTLAIDIAPSNDYSSAQSGNSVGQNSSSKDFSQVIDEHYQVQQSGNKSESSGNKSKTTTDTHSDKVSSPDKSDVSEETIKEKSPESVADKKIVEESNNEQVTSTKKVSTNENAEAQSSHVTGSSEKTKIDNIDQPVVTEGTDNSQASAEQLISLLSASEKILSSESSQQKSIIKESEPVAQEKSQTKTDIDALLRQVLLGNDKKQKSENIATDKSSTDTNAKQQATAEVNVGQVVNKVEPKKSRAKKQVNV